MYITEKRVKELIMKSNHPLSTSSLKLQGQPFLHVKFLVYLVVTAIYLSTMV